MTRGRQRANGEGSIFPYRNGYAAYVWVTTPDGKRRRKWVYGKTRQNVHGKWLKLHDATRRGPVPTSTPRPRKVKPWTAEEARQFLESARRDQDPLYAAYVLILVMGLRKGEVVGLPWSAVNLDRAELDIGWQLQRVRGQLLHRETKTEASEATLPMPGICVTALRIREKDQAVAKAAAGASWVQSGLVFTTRAGTPFEPRNLNRRFETRCAKAGVRRITVHDMRHTCATLLAALDVHPRVAMRILRHAQIDVTMNVYTEVSDAKTLKALRRLGRKLGS
jgi:integrase